LLNNADINLSNIQSQFQSQLDSIVYQQSQTNGIVNTNIGNINPIYFNSNGDNNRRGISFGSFTVPQADLVKGKKLELRITFTQDIRQDIDYCLHIILRTTDTPTVNIYDGNYPTNYSILCSM
jgi:hypothetical protein